MKVIFVIAFSLLFVPTPSPYQLTQEIMEAYERDTTAARSTLASYAFSYNGDYRQALDFGDRNTFSYSKITASDSVYFLSLKPINAQNYILKRAAAEQIIIINEMHHVPLHRVFTESLLERLYAAGFRYFGAETLSFLDSTINERNYPVLESGYYTKEPQYGNLIRRALQLGFKVFDYEARTPEDFGNGKTREIAQARHIQRIIQQDPQAKILIHCGYDHVQEGFIGGAWEKAMAGRLKELTGINPFTIDQVKLTERSKPQYENPYYRLAQVKEPSVFVSTSGEPFAGSPDAPKLTDIRVCHPKTSYVYGRPHWLLRQGKWKPLYLKVNTLKVDFPCLVMAWPEGEPTNKAIPVDVMEWKEAAEKKALILPPGKYNLLLRDDAGKTQQIKAKIK